MKPAFSSHVCLMIFDLLGRRIALLFDEEKSAGRYEVTSDATFLPSGTYHYRLETPADTLSRSMVMVN